ncbi:unnamed protein product [Cylicocyclus nassatus]|uniref:Uncharacterized protein n=1 Tax=Cylicocyclus nassatus TaxID=53992 RepID=A0AA36M255_CYLNA|nr:unnamed protein product [Cylicocyclus nassatus]
MASDQVFVFRENAYDGDSYRRSRDGRRGRRYFDDESSKHKKYNSSGYHHYTSEDTQWTFPNSEISDPVYIRDESIGSDFVPLPRIQSECNLNADARIEEHFIGVRSTDEAAAAVKPDDFALYYKFDSDGHVRSTIPLFLVHRNTRNEVFHFPVKRIDEGNGTKWWYVQIGNNKMQSFRQLSDLVRCYHLYRFTDARSGRMEVFPLWKGGVIDDFE